MVVGICSRNEDMTVNVCKKKQLTNMRASGSDEALRLVSPKIFSLEQCLEFLADDEILECTPKSLRIRKRELDHALRMRNLMKKRNGEWYHETGIVHPGSFLPGKMQSDCGTAHLFRHGL